MEIGYRGMLQRARRDIQAAKEAFRLQELTADCGMEDVVQFVEKVEQWGN